ncbi:MAG TPA: SDR family NAD(P)-dependent oxidoreductase, partial [Myxococcales bacterium]|nr:SDR family NAD(P)-dependent oxidoreductase [Myxococcales bacterium]
EMLDLDLDLEADLGVDTVKQAETFAAVREAYGIARDAQLKLRDFPTIRHVIQFVRDRAGVAAAAPAPAVKGEAKIAAASAFPRRVPVPVLRPPIAFCKDTGVGLARVAIVPDQGPVAAALGNLMPGAEIVSIDAPDLDGVFWLPALDEEPALDELTPQAWREGLDLRVKRLAKAARALHARLGKGRFLIAATRGTPMGGAVSGFMKALARERGEAVIKSVEFERGEAAGSIAAMLVEEATRDPGAVEILRRSGRRFTLAALDQPAPAPEAAPARLVNGTYLITGAAGSIVSAITCRLAARGGTFWLVDRFPEPDVNDPDLARVEGDREGLKTSLIERAHARGEKPTPVAIERELARIERLAAGATAIKAIRAAGGTARWAQADLCDAEAVRKALGEVERADVVLHCAGLEISRLLPDKTDEEFARVFDVKADGFFHLLHALRGKPLGTVITFGSIAGRFGNAGQTDYSAANDLLAHCVRSLPRGLQLDWTAWARIGMASRGSIPAMMEAAGIEMLPPEEGIAALERELDAGTRGEVIVAGRLGVLLDERDAQGGIDPARIDLASRGPMLGRAAGSSVQDGFVVETTLDPRAQPFLADHQIDGTPVLPGVMGVEAFAELASLLAPGFRVKSVEDVEFLAPFKFYKGEPRALRLSARVRADGEELLAECALVGERQLQGQPQRTTHFTAKVRLARGLPPQITLERPEPNGHALKAPDIYRVYFHGPAYQVLERAWNEGQSTVGLLPATLPADHDAARPLTLDPRLIELCFQTAGLREMRARHQMGLPQHIDRIEALGASARGRLEAVVADDGAGGFDADVIDESGHALLRVHGYRTAMLPSPLDPAFVERLGELG